MTTAEAYKILNGKLVFGDPNQIAANQYLGAFKDACRAIECCCDAGHRHIDTQCRYFKDIDPEAVLEALKREWIN